MRTWTSRSSVTRIRHTIEIPGADFAPQPLEPRQLMSAALAPLAEATIDLHAVTGAAVQSPDAHSHAGAATGGLSLDGSVAAYSRSPIPGNEQVPPGGSPDAPAPTIPADGRWEDGQSAPKSGDRPPGSDIAGDTTVGAGGGIGPTIVDHDASGPLADDQGVLSGAAGPSGISVIAVNPNGVPIAFRLVDGQWQGRALSGLVGALGADGDIAVFLDPKDSHTYAVILDRGILTLYRERADGTFGDPRTLNDITVAGNSLVSRLTVFASADNRMHIGGLNEDGQLIMFSQDGERLAGDDTSWAWTFENIELTHLAPQGLSTPVWQGELTVYVTAWNGINIAGLTASGDVLVVWWAPGMQHWSSDNLSDNTGLTTLVGGLTSYVTPWGGLNIAGIDTSGDLQVVWWVPGFASQWRSTNLTSEFQGDKLDPATVSSFVTPWGGLNVVGVNTLTGDAFTYWWTPGQTAWTAEAISFNKDPDVPLPTGRLVAVNDGTQLNLFGRADSGEVIRLYWNPGDGGVWSVENVSQVSL